MLDASVYVGHGHVFATAQSGNVVLLAMALIAGDRSDTSRHALSLAAFVAGLLVSRLAAGPLHRSPLNSRTVRLMIEAGMLLLLSGSASRLPDAIVIVAVGLIAAIQITSLSHIGDWSFNTGMTTGNLRGAVTAFAKALDGDHSQWARSGAIGAPCLAFLAGALAGTWSQLHVGDLTLAAVAAVIALSAILSRRVPDPVPAWETLTVPSRDRR